MIKAKHVEPEYEFIFEGVTISFWYNSKTHQYNIVDGERIQELIMSKAKAEAVIKFLRWITE